MLGYLAPAAGRVIWASTAADGIGRGGAATVGLGLNKGRRSGSGSIEFLSLQWLGQG